MIDSASARSMQGPRGTVRTLLAALGNAAAAASYDESHWDRVIPLARRARLLGVLAHRVFESVDRARLPDRVRRHLDAGLIEARFRRQKTLYLLHTIMPIIESQPGPWVLLKGAGYIAQDLALSHGRLPADVDLLVRRASLDGIEKGLLTAGWEFEKSESYDQHYYRAWSHELPPMVAAGQAMELDLHHTILPPVGRIRPDTARLFADAVPVQGSPFHVLCPQDQVLHAVVHLVHDSDFVGRLRDLLDIDALFRRLPLSDQTARSALVERARLHGMLRPLHLAANLCEGWFDTPGCDALIRETADAVSVLYGKWIASLASRVLPPVNARKGSTRFPALLLEGRSHWLRMPPWLLAYHAASKGVRNLSQFATKRERTAEG